MTKNPKTEKRARRAKRVRAKISGTMEKPRLSVFKSNRFVSAQLIDDTKGVTIASGTTKTIKGKNSVERAKILGTELAKAAAAKKITLAVFDRGGYLYTGSVAAVAEGAREGGLKF